MSSGRPDSPALPDAVALLRSRNYLVLVLLGAVVGVVVAAVAYVFLKAVGEAQQFIFTTLPSEAGYRTRPLWWPAPWLALSGLLVALTIRLLPGAAGHKPAEGFKAGGPVQRIELPGIVLASFATLSLGVVLGPEAPLIAIGSGLGVLAMHLLENDAPSQATVIVAAAGSFAAIAALFGSPLAGAFLLLEATGLGGPLLGVVLVPGLLAAGVGALIFVGLDSWTGFGTFSLAIPDVPHFGVPTGAEFLWAIAIGLAGAVLGSSISRLALLLQRVVERRMVLLMPFAGLAVAACAIVFQKAAGHDSSYVLFSGQTALPTLIQGAANWTVGALALLVVCKGIAYSLSLSSFRGGPTFPGMFIGAAGGIALSHLPGLPEIAGAAMGIGAMTVAMLGLPFTSVLLVSLFMPSDAVRLMPLVIVAVVVSYIASARVASDRRPAH